GLGRLGLPGPAHDRRPHPASAREARARPAKSRLPPDGARGRLPVQGRMIWRRIWSNSIKNRLTFLFFAITAGAILVIYFYVVPQLESNLTSQKLDALKEDAATYARPLQRASTSEVRRSQLDSLTRTLSEESGTRVTLL